MKYKKGYKYKLAEDFIYEFNTPIEVDDIMASYITMEKGAVLIWKGYAWDGASGPAIDTDTFMRGSLVHDALYQLMREGHLDISYRDWADRELRAVCLEDGMSRIRAWWVYWVLRLFGEFAAKEGRKIWEI